MGMSYRNIVSSGVINNIESNYEVTFLTLEGAKLESILINKNKKVVSFKLGVIQKLARRLCLPIETLQFYSFFQKHNTNTIKKYIQRDKKNKFFRFFYKLSEVIGKKYDKYSFFSAHYRYFLPKSTIGIINEYDSVLILSSDDLLDKSLLKITNENNVNSILMIHSWDNLPARGFFSSVPDKVLVWNDVMKEQAVTLHGISRDKIEVIGVPQFYGYKHLESCVDENMFKCFYGLKNEYDIITYTCSASRVFPDESLFIQELIKYIKDKDIYLILRLHPTERADEYTSRFHGFEKVVIDRPSGNFAASITDNIKDDESELLKFVSLMKYSDVVVNLASTTTLDATIFDTPVVCLSFNMDKDIGDTVWNNASDWYRSSHYEYIVGSGAVKIAKSMDEFLIYASEYLKDSGMDSDNRKRLNHDFCKIHYDVSQRISESIL